MPGFFSQMFDGADDSRSFDNAQHLGAQEYFDVEQTVGVGHSEDVSYQTADGSTHSYSNSQDLTLTVGVQSTLGAAADTTQHVTTGESDLL